MDQLSITQVTKCKWKKLQHVANASWRKMTWHDVTMLFYITKLLKDLASLHGLILTRKARSIPGLNDFKIEVSPLDAFSIFKPVEAALVPAKKNIGSVSTMPRTDLHDPWPCMCISTCSWQPSAHSTTTQQIYRTEYLGLWWRVYMCAMTLVNRSIEVDEVTLLIASMFSLEGMNQMITCSFRDKRSAKANLNHEEPKAIKMSSSPLILIARRNESNWSSYIALQRLQCAKRDRTYAVALL